MERRDTGVEYDRGTIGVRSEYGRGTFGARSGYDRALVWTTDLHPNYLICKVIAINWA